MAFRKTHIRLPIGGQRQGTVDFPLPQLYYFSFPTRNNHSFGMGDMVNRKNSHQNKNDCMLRSICEKEDCPIHDKKVRKFME